MIWGQIWVKLKSQGTPEKTVLLLLLMLFFLIITPMCVQVLVFSDEFGFSLFINVFSAIEMG